MLREELSLARDACQSADQRRLGRLLVRGVQMFQPKQRRTIKKIGGRMCQHANLMAANRSERNRCSRSTLGNGAELEVSLRNSKFSQHPCGRVAIYQSSRPKMWFCIGCISAAAAMLQSRAVLPSQP
jgi:hypothetical protein